MQQRWTLLKTVEPGEQPARLHQFGQVAALPDLPLLDDDNLVGSLDGREAVRNHDHRAILAHFLKRFLDPMLGNAVEGIGCLIENQDARIANDCAREG